MKIGKLAKPVPTLAKCLIILVLISFSYVWIITSTKIDWSRALTYALNSNPTLNDYATEKMYHKIYDMEDHHLKSYSTPNLMTVHTKDLTGKFPTKTLNDDIKIVWLMSFPNSGTSYTGSLIRTITQTHTASNYGTEDMSVITRKSVPVYDDQPTGPFYIEYFPERNPERTKPKKYVLTKTHCGFRCEICPPEEYLETTFSFRKRCLSGSWSEELEDGTFKIVYGSYPSKHVTKAIHLIRDPFDNIVSRYHLELPRLTNGNYTPDRDGFRTFCNDLNTMYVKDEEKYNFLDKETFKSISDIPCRADFFRYTEWHNLAFTTAHDLKLPTLIVHYDDYSNHFNSTVMTLLTFLEEEVRNEPAPFELGKTYGDYFTTDERRRIGAVMKTMSSTLTWENLERYFEMTKE